MSCLHLNLSVSLLDDLAFSTVAGVIALAFGVALLVSVLLVACYCCCCQSRQIASQSPQQERIINRLRESGRIFLIILIQDNGSCYVMAPLLQ